MAQAPQNTQAAPAFLVTGGYQGAKAPLQNGVVALINNQVVSFSSPTSTPVQSTAPALANPQGLCGDINNGVAVYSGTKVAYLNSVGVAGARWYSLPALPSGAGSIKAMSGDLLNGLVISDGTNLYSLQFSGGAPEWTLLTAPPAGTIIGVAGDPTNGVLLVIGSANGPSSLYYAAGGCSCAWVPLSAGGSSLPVARIQVSLVCGNANGFIVFGENQFYTYTVKFTPGSATAPAVAAATPNRLPPPPFAVTAITGDPVNGCTALAGASGLIANTGNSFSGWTVISASAPTPAPSAPSAPSAPAGGNGNAGAAAPEQMQQAA